VLGRLGQVDRTVTPFLPVMGLALVAAVVPVLAAPCAWMLHEMGCPRGGSPSG
jgi:hypothetical protein